MLIFAIHTVVLLAVLAGLLVLQVFLSRSPNRWPGLILPGLTVLFSLLCVLSIAVFPGASPWEIVRTLILGFLMYNIPTYILLAVYWCARWKYRRQAQLDKMNAQDLE